MGRLITVEEIVDKYHGYDTKAKRVTSRDFISSRQGSPNGEGDNHPSGSKKKHESFVEAIDENSGRDADKPTPNVDNASNKSLLLGRFHANVVQYLWEVCADQSGTTGLGTYSSDSCE